MNHSIQYLCGAGSLLLQRFCCLKLPKIFSWQMYCSDRSRQSLRAGARNLDASTFLISKNDMHIMISLHHHPRTVWRCTRPAIQKISLVICFSVKCLRPDPVPLWILASCQFPTQPRLREQVPGTALESNYWPFWALASSRWVLHHPASTMSCFMQNCLSLEPFPRDNHHRTQA